MKITKELIESMVREALNEVAEAKPEAEADPYAAKPAASNDVSRILTKQDMERINMPQELIDALEVITKHASRVPRGKQILLNLYKELPGIVKSLK